MSLDDVTKILETAGFPVVYRAWPEEQAPSLPYICYLVNGSNNFSADGIVYHKSLRVAVELYTKNKDLKAEESVENALSSFYWEKSEDYIDSEQCYQIIYEIEV